MPSPVLNPPGPHPPPPKSDILIDDAVSSTTGPRSIPGARHTISTTYPDPEPVPLDHTSDANSPGSNHPESAEDIEMDVIGHRRRKSNLTNNQTAGPISAKTPRTPGQASRNGAVLPEDAKTMGGVEGEAVSGADDAAGLDSDSDETLHDDEEMGLTNTDRQRRRTKKRRNTQLDQRIARENISAEEKREADQNVAKRLLINASLIGLWYLFSLCISLYNKWMFDKNKLNFPFPLFTTAAHMLVQFGLASLVLYFVPSLRPSHKQGSDLGRSRHEAEPGSPLMTKMFYLTRIGPCGAATGLDIGLGNTSLKFVTLTFYTMCKSSALAFVLIFAFLFRLEVPTWKLVAIIATMTVGVIMMVAGEVEFKLGGFLLVISAAFFSGFRWALTQILLLRNPATSNPFSGIFYLSPIMFATLLFIALAAEGFSALLEGIGVLMQEWGAILTPCFLLFPGCIAFCMTASEFALLQRTSVVTLSIAGIFKEVVTISAAAVVFHDRLTPINFVGLVTTMAAIGSYNYIKITKMRKQEQTEIQKGHVDAGSGSGSSPSHSGSDAENDTEPGEEIGLLRQSQESRDANGDEGPGLAGSGRDDNRQA